MKFATKPTQYYLPHLRNFATLPWEIKISNYLHTDIQQMCKKMQTKCIFIPLTLLFIHKF